MPMSSAQRQTQFFGDPSGDAVQIETDGRTIRPAMALLTPFVDELRLDVRKKALHTRHVDPANVAMGDVRVYADAFDTFDVDGEEFTAGLNVNLLSSTLANARMGRRTNDSVSLDLDETRSLVSITRDYTQHSLDLTNEQLNLDPDRVRESPNRPPLDEYHAWTAEIDVRAFYDVVNHFDANHVRITESDGHLVFGDGPNADGLDTDSEYPAVGDFGAIAEPKNNAEDGAASIISMDYLTSAAKALKNGKVTDLTIAWGTEAPLQLKFERIVEETKLFEGEYVISPRITTEDN